MFVIAIRLDNESEDINTSVERAEMLGGRSHVTRKLRN
jgi:hypothetical protein